MTKWLNDDGSLNAAAFDALEESLRAVTDSNKQMDAVLKGARIGEPVVVAFKCNHSGLYFPPDYVKMFGKSYGIGLGPDPVSEVLDSDYDTAPPRLDDNITDILQIMHPLQSTRVQVDLVTIPQDEWETSQAILSKDDPSYRKRVAIIRPKQLANARGGQLRSLQTAWAMQTGMSPVALQKA